MHFGAQKTGISYITAVDQRRNESFGELKWPLSACSGMRTLGSGTGSQNGFHIMVCRLTQGVLRLCSGSPQALLRLAHPQLRSAQVKAAVAHVRRLKRNQRKGKLIPSLWVFRDKSVRFGRDRGIGSPEVADVGC
jgi:hypothetical protein